MGRRLGQGRGGGDKEGRDKNKRTVNGSGQER